MTPSVEILAVGTEILTGEVRDANTVLLARTATGHGGTVTRAAVLPDDPESLRKWIAEALARAPRVLFTCGGLGPTADDGTLAAVAAAAGVPVEEDREALRMVAGRYAALAAAGFVADGRLTPERAKMARLPRGARAVANPVGAAPAAVLACGETTVIALPGVPEELEGILAGPLRPILEERFVAGVHLLEEVVVATGDESMLAPAVDAVGAAFPGVRVKSRARKFGGGEGMRVTLSARGGSEGEVRALLGRCREALERACSARGLRMAERDKEGTMAGSEGNARLLELIREKALKRGDFTLASGKKSDYYLDGKQVTLDGEGALLVAEAILDRIRDDNADAVGGLTLGADPIAGAVAAVAAGKGRKLRAFIVRKEVKDHGTSRRVEGPVSAGSRCVVVEDVCSTGASALKAVDALVEAGCTVVRIVTIVDREMGAAELFRERRIPYSPIFTKTEVLG